MRSLTSFVSVSTEQISRLCNNNIRSELSNCSIIRWSSFSNNGAVWSCQWWTWRMSWQKRGKFKWLVNYCSFIRQTPTSTANRSNATWDDGNARAVREGEGGTSTRETTHPGNLCVNNQTDRHHIYIQQCLLHKSSILTDIKSKLVDE